MSAKAISTQASSPLLRYRSAVLVRAVAGFGGGYVLSAAFAAAFGLVCVQWCGMARTEAVTVATMLSFVVLAVAVLWAFACANTKRVCLGIAMPAVLLGLLAWMLSGGQA